jgi:hypothetical protein
MTTLRRMVWKLIEEIDNQTAPWALGTLADELRDYMNDNPEAMPTDDELNELFRFGQTRTGFVTCTRSTHMKF